jgi:hypothetical protein
VCCELHGGGHESVALPRDTPAARVRDLGDESVRVEDLQLPRDASALAALAARVVSGCVESLSDVVVSEAHERVLAA